MFPFRDLATAVGPFKFDIWFSQCCYAIKNQISVLKIEKCHCQKASQVRDSPLYLWKGEAISIGMEGLYIAFRISIALSAMLQGKVWSPLSGKFWKFLLTVHRLQDQIYKWFMPMPIEYVHGMACKRCGIQMTCHWFRNLRTLKNGKCKQNYKTNTKVQSKSKNTRISRRKTNWTQEVSMLAFNRRICLRSIMMTVAIALERYVAVHYPINYSQESHLQCFINKKLRTM